MPLTIPRCRVADPTTLLGRFGLKSFRPGQRDVVDALASGADCLCVMPTGGGKSLCYQLPALAREGTTIVVSPLIALMKDQVDTLRAHGIAARLINSTLSQREQETVMDELAGGGLEMVYVAPERLRNGRFLDAVQKADVTLLAVDEAHCVSEWGHDFRPDYSRLGRFRQKYLGGVQTIALTATATPTVRDDICELLELNQPQVFVTGFARTNLRFAVQSCNNDTAKQDTLARYLSKQNGAGIIYGATRKRCEEVAAWLPEATGRRVGVYHAGMHPDDRRKVQDEFMSGRLSVIVATNAFGMGIDKSDIRFVVHFNMPGSLEAYYQEAGRAGRDGAMSDCLLLFAYSDRSIQEFFIENRYPSRDTVRKVYEYLLSREEDPIELTLDQIREAINVRDGSEAIGTAETLLGRAGVLKRLDAGANQCVLRIDSEVPTLLDFLPREAKLKRKVMTAIEKIVGNRRGEDVFVRPSYLATVADVDRDQLSRTLRELQRLKSFDYVPPFRGRGVHITRRDLSFDQLDIDFEELARRKAAEYDKLSAVIGFARAARCRQHVVLDYFGDPNAGACGNCDRCDPSNHCDASGNFKPAGMMTGTEMMTAPQPPSNLDEGALLTGVRVILSGVTRTHGRFGKTLVAQMLGGSNNKKITSMRLNRLATYGLLSAMKQADLTQLLDAMLATGWIEQQETKERRPTICITDVGRTIMKMTSGSLPASFQIKPPLARRLAAAAAKIETRDVSEGPVEQLEVAAQAETINSPVDDAGNDLMDRLKRFRRKRAAAMNVPTHRILSNSAMERIVQQRPKNALQLESIEGITSEFVEMYGSDLLELIAVSQPEALAPPEIPKDDDPYWTWRLFRDGYAMNQVAKIRRLGPSTLVDHLIAMASEGQIVDPAWCDTDDARKQLREAVTEH